LLALNLRQGQFWWYNSLALSEEHELMEVEAVGMPWLAMKLWPGKVWWQSLVVQSLGRVKEYELIENR
jgi:hypothetical protein